MDGEMENCTGTLASGSDASAKGLGHVPVVRELARGVMPRVHRLL
jgi:hypothetical protein